MWSFTVNVLLNDCVVCLSFGSSSFFFPPAAMQVGFYFQVVILETFEVDCGEIHMYRYGVCSEERAERLALLRNHIGTKPATPDLSRVRAPRKGGKRHHNGTGGDQGLWVSQGDCDSESPDGLKKFRPKVLFLYTNIRNARSFVRLKSCSYKSSVTFWGSIYRMSKRPCVFCRELWCYLDEWQLTRRL